MKSSPNPDRPGRRNDSEALSAHIKTRILGRSLSYFPSIDSTNHYALHVAGGPNLHGRILVTDRQTAGRGRYGRSWVSRPGRDLLFSLILYPPNPKALWNLLTLIMAVSICEALREQQRLNAEIRWPNDVTIDGKKVCGILTEVSREVDDRLVVGVGINVNSDVSDFPEELRSTLTTLKAVSGRSIQRWPLLNAILMRFEGHYDRFMRRDTEHLADLCRRWTGTLGRVVEVNLAERRFIASAIDLEENGSLVVRHENGTIEKLHSGDVVEIKSTQSRK